MRVKLFKDHKKREKQQNVSKNKSLKQNLLHDNTLFFYNFVPKANDEEENCLTTLFEHKAYSNLLGLAATEACNE